MVKVKGSVTGEKTVCEWNPRSHFPNGLLRRTVAVAHRSHIQHCIRSERRGEGRVWGGEPTAHVRRVTSRRTPLARSSSETAFAPSASLAAENASRRPRAVRRPPVSAPSSHALGGAISEEVGPADKRDPFRCRESDGKLGKHARGASRI